MAAPAGHWPDVTLLATFGTRSSLLVGFGVCSNTVCGTLAHLVRLNVDQALEHWLCVVQGAPSMTCGIVTSMDRCGVPALPLVCSSVDPHNAVVHVSAQHRLLAPWIVPLHLGQCLHSRRLCSWVHN